MKLEHLNEAQYYRKPTDSIVDHIAKIIIDHMVRDWDEFVGEEEEWIEEQIQSMIYEQMEELGHTIDDQILNKVLEYLRKNNKL